ncbi:MAG: CPBP family intramembrane metalloprotease [Firmicutes bacterium]|nr:CPBP family intramembrane metalloprotease [Bacillota bacterium]
MIKTLSKIQNLALKYRLEIILACSTTFIIAGLYTEKYLPMYLVSNQELFYKYLPWAGAFKSGFFIRGIPDSVLPVLQGICSDISGMWIIRFSSIPLPQIVFFFLLPLISLFVLKIDPVAYGFRIGNFRQGIIYTAICLAVMAPFLWWAARMPSFIKYYSSVNSGGFWTVVIQYGFYLFCWEYLYRGYLYFSLEERTGNLAIWIQSIPFAITHLGKPPAEALTCYFGGLILGYIAMKTRSFSYAFLIHWGIYVILTFCVFSRIGYFTK